MQQLPRRQLHLSRHLLFSHPLLLPSPHRLRRPHQLQQQLPLQLLLLHLLSTQHFNSQYNNHRLTRPQWLSWDKTMQVPRLQSQSPLHQCSKRRQCRASFPRHLNFLLSNRPLKFNHRPRTWELQPLAILVPPRPRKFHRLLCPLPQFQIPGYQTVSLPRVRLVHNPFQSIRWLRHPLPYRPPHH